MWVFRAQLGSSLVETGTNGATHTLSNAQLKPMVTCGTGDPVWPEVLIL